MTTPYAPAPEVPQYLHDIAAAVQLVQQAKRWLRQIYGSEGELRAIWMTRALYRRLMESLSEEGMGVLMASEQPNKTEIGAALVLPEGEQRPPSIAGVAVRISELPQATFGFDRLHDVILQARPDSTLQLLQYTEGWRELLPRDERCPACKGAR